MRTAIVMGGTPNLAGPAGVSFLSLRAMSPQLFQQAEKFFLSSRKLAACDLAVLNSLNVKVGIFDVGIGISKKASNYIKYFSEGILAKFEVFRLAEKYDRVIWMDCDQICIRELIFVLDENIGYDFLITAGEADSNGWGNFIKEPKILKQLLLKNSHTSFEKKGLVGNFYVVQVKGKVAYDRGRELFALLESDLYGGEQGVLYILIQEFFSKNVQFLNRNFFTPHPVDWPIDRIFSVCPSERPYLIHAFAQPKFWNGYYHPLWDNWYREWLGLGGSEFVSGGHNTDLLKKIWSKFRRLLKNG